MGQIADLIRRVPDGKEHPEALADLVALARNQPYTHARSRITLREPTMN